MRQTAHNKTQNKTSETNKNLPHYTSPSIPCSRGADGTLGDWLSFDQAAYHSMHKRSYSCTPTTRRASYNMGAAGQPTYMQRCCNQLCGNCTVQALGQPCCNCPPHGKPWHQAETAHPAPTSSPGGTVGNSATSMTVLQPAGAGLYCNQQEQDCTATSRSRTVLQPAGLYCNQQEQDCTATSRSRTVLQPSGMYCNQQEQDCTATSRYVTALQPTGAELHCNHACPVAIAGGCNEHLQQLQTGTSSYQ
jgi:hypothetical protein